MYLISDKGYTMVELVITVSILVILATIAFFSVKGYIQSAENAVRIEDIGKIVGIVENKSARGAGLMSFTEGGQEVLGAQIGGTGAIVLGNYKAGDILPSVLEIKSPDFEDPRGDIYKIGVTTKNKGKYQLSSILDTGAGDVAKVVGGYSPRDQEPISGIGKMNSNMFTLTYPEDARAFYSRDIVTGVGVPIGTMVKYISSDGMRITLDRRLTADITSLELGNDEVDGLISGGTTSTSAVVDGSEVVPY